MTELFQAGLALADVHMATRFHEQDMKYKKLSLLHRQIDERSEQLRSISNIAALIAGFSVVVLIEMNLPEDVPVSLVTFFGVSTAATVCLMSLSFVTCTLMLVGVLKAFDLERAKMPFQQFWVLKCEEDWMRAFGFFSAGVPMFMLNLLLAGWVKYWHYKVTASLISVVCVFGLLGWFQVHWKWGKYLVQEVEFSADMGMINSSRSDPETSSNSHNGPPRQNRSSYYTDNGSADSSRTNSPATVPSNHSTHEKFTVST